MPDHLTPAAEALHDRFCDFPKPHGCMVTERLLAIQSEARATADAEVARLRSALEMDGTERRFREVMGDAEWSRAQDDGWMRANVWHLMDVLDKARAALAATPPAPATQVLEPAPVSTPALTAARLAEARSRSGMTLREAAPRLGIDFTYLSKVENGHERPSDALLLRMCDLYGLEPDAVVLARAVAEVPEPVRAAIEAAALTRGLAGSGVCGECPHAAHTGDICDTDRTGFITGCPCRTATPPAPALPCAFVSTDGTGRVCGMAEGAQMHDLFHRYVPPTPALTAAQALREAARLVSQWGDAVDPMPDELRAELRDLRALVLEAMP